MALATLSIDLEAKLAKMEQGFDRASRLSEKFALEQERRFNAIKGAATGIGAAIAGAFTATQLVQMTRATIDSLDALNDLKDATGASIENLSALEDIAARTGTSFEAVSSTLVKFNKVLGDAKPGSEAANILKLIGLSAEELRRQDPAEALRLTAVALSQFADDVNKARVVQELFGKSIQEAAPFLKDLAEQGALNAKVTTEQAQAAEDFNKQLFNLQKNMADTGRSIVSDLLPALNTFFDRLKNIKDAGGVSAFFGSIGNEFKSQLISEEIAGTVREIELLQKRLDTGAPSQYERNGLERRIGALRQQFLDLQSQAASTKAELLGFADKVAPLPDEYSNEGYRKTRGSVGIAPGADKKAKKEKEKKEQFFTDTSAIQELIDLEREFQAVLARRPTEVLERQRTLMERIAKAYEDGEFGLVGSEEAARKYAETVETALPKAVETALPEIERLANESSEFFAEAARNIQDTMGDTLVDALEGNFNDIGKMWERLLVRMASQAIAAKLNQQLFGSDFGKTGQLGGLLGSLFGTGGTYPTGGYYDGGAGGGYNIPSAGPQSAGSGRMAAAQVINIGQVGSNVSRAEMFDAVTKAVAASEGRQMQRMRAAGVA